MGGEKERGFDSRVNVSKRSQNIRTNNQCIPMGVCMCGVFWFRQTLGRCFRRRRFFFHPAQWGFKKYKDKTNLNLSREKFLGVMKTGRVTVLDLSRAALTRAHIHRYTRTLVVMNFLACKINLFSEGWTVFTAHVA